MLLTHMVSTEKKVVLVLRGAAGLEQLKPVAPGACMGSTHQWDDASSSRADLMLI